MPAHAHTPRGSPGALAPKPAPVLAPKPPAGAPKPAPVLAPKPPAPPNEGVPPVEAPKPPALTPTPPVLAPKPPAPADAAGVPKDSCEGVAGGAGVAGCDAVPPPKMDPAAGEPVNQ